MHSCDAGASAAPVKLDVASSLQQKTKVKAAGFASLLELCLSQLQPHVFAEPLASPEGENLSRD